MTGPTPFRDILLVATFEVREMLRTRRALVVIGLYLMGGLLAAEGFVSILEQIEEAVAAALATTTGATPGAITAQLVNEPQYRRMVQSLISDKDSAAFVLSLQPMAAFFAWVSLRMVPLLIALTAADTIPTETQNRGVRFIALRTGRLEFLVGKMLGQGMLMALVTLLMGGVFVAVALSNLQGAEFTTMVLSITRLWPRVVLYSIPFLGLIALLTVSAPSIMVARAFALGGILGLWIIEGLAQRFRLEENGSWWELISFLLPFGHRESLWSPHMLDLLHTAILLLALTALYLGGAIYLYGRRDL